MTAQLRAIGRRIRGFQTSAWVRSSSGVHSVTIAFDRFRVDDRGQLGLVGHITPPYPHNSAPLIVLQIDQPLWAHLSPIRQAERIEGEIYDGTTLRLVEPFLARCSECDSDEEGPYCSGCGAQIRTRPELLGAPCKHPNPLTPYCTACGEPQARSTRRAGRFSDIGH